MVGLIPNTLFLVVITSTLLAGIRRGSGLTFQTNQIQNAPAARAISIYLTIGEWAYERLVGFARGSKYFKFDPNVSVDGVKAQVNEFTEGIKAAAEHLAKSE